MIRRSFISLMAIGAVSALLTLSPPTAHAIPVAGDYVFTSGLTGTFTSDGTRLTAWNFTAPTSTVLWTDESVIQKEYMNDQTTFLTDDYIALRNILLYWEVQHGRDWSWSVYAPISGPTYGSFSYQPTTTSVPEPSALLLQGLGLGVLALMGYVNRQRRHAELHVG